MKNFIRQMVRLYPSIKPQGYSLSIREVRRDEFKLGKLTVHSVPTGHTSTSVAFRFDDGKKSLAYSGDATLTEELESLSKDADLLVCECSYPAGWNTADHMNADAVGKLAKQSSPKTLVITHRYPPTLSVDLAQQIGQTYSGRIILAEDGLRLKV